MKFANIFFNLKLAKTVNENKSSSTDFHYLKHFLSFFFFSFSLSLEAWDFQCSTSPCFLIKYSSRSQRFNYSNFENKKESV